MRLLDVIQDESFVSYMTQVLQALPQVSQRHRAVQGAGEPKRPPNAYFLYAKEEAAKLKRDAAERGRIAEKVVSGWRALGQQKRTHLEDAQLDSPYQRDLAEYRKDGHRLG